MNYSEYFKDRVVIISGVGRSGTTILGKIVGSMKTCLYFFEPTILKFLPASYYIKSEELKNLFLATLFEDYILPSVYGRYLNNRPDDWSKWDNYQSYDDVTEKWSINSRQDALKWIEDNNVLFVFKVNESQHLYSIYKDLFEGMRLIYIYRNGVDTVNSMIKRNWYTDDYQPMDFCYYNTNIPVWVEYEYINSWKSWNKETRCCYAWRRLNTIGFDWISDGHTNIPFDDHVIFRYETLLFYCSNIVEFLNNWLGLKETSLVLKHITSVYDFAIKNKDIKEDRSFLKLVDEQERENFLDLNKTLG